MKRKTNLLSFISGILITLLLVSMVVPATAALLGKDITVYPGVNIFVDDQKLEPKDANGNPVEVFIYNGTTYLPVRAVSEALGQPVQWDGNTSSVYIGKHMGEKPAVWLCDLDYYYQQGYWNLGRETIDNLGNKHQKSLYLKSDYSDNHIVYKLNGQYSKLTGYFYQLYDHRSDDYKTTLNVYGDGELLYSASVGRGIDPIEFSIDLTGVLELKIQGSWELVRYSALGDVGLWT